MNLAAEKAREVVNQVNQVILGKEKETEEVFLAFLANGHVLLEDVPGVGKTTLASAFSRTMALDCRRVQFTPDVMPSDLTGFSVYKREEERFAYQQGSVFCNLLLADEINRTSPKTQSALLEVMEEGRVTVEGVTREVPCPFLVIATQNPIGSAGTQRLPEAQMDRFMITVTLGYPDFKHELSMAMAVGERNRLDSVRPVIGRDEFVSMQKQIHQIYIKENVYQYITQLVTATRSHPYLDYGASPRATIALVKMARAAAWFHGSSYVVPQEVERQFAYVISHRIVLNASARMEGIRREEIVDEIVRKVRKPRMGEWGA
ncbi:MoxR family ATPase [bacterium C-53]|nr:MoxR family ATPase [Lachnospiraceae bacterium]NBI03544.1 MoxR family ATPase [Lachnospiraceae bacterium]RKJ09543.1 MoxR family ATPase [bacterium C-53]